jgi:hypothetical protein
MSARCALGPGRCRTSLESWPIYTNLLSPGLPAKLRIPACIECKGLRCRRLS